MWQNSKTETETKHKIFKCDKIQNSNCDKTKKENCDKTQKLKLRQNFENSNCEKLKNPNVEKLKIQLLYWQNLKKKIKQTKL